MTGDTTFPPTHHPVVASPAGAPLADLVDRVAVVTGAASGIGLGIARALTRAGARVVVVDVNRQAAEEAATSLDAAAARVDVTESDSLVELAQWVHETYGRVDLLVNNAGVGPLDTFESLTMDDLHWVMNINFWGVVHGINAFLPYLKGNNDGAAIVNTASMAAVLPSRGITAYGASKAAVLSLSDSLREELADTRVGVTVLLPALVATSIIDNASARPGHAIRARETTDFLPPGRTITPDEVGELVVDGLRRGATHIFTHPETAEILRAHHASLLASYPTEQS